MKARLNKKNETVTITLNADELWVIRHASAELWQDYYDRKLYRQADEAWKVRETTDKAAEYLFRNWG